MDVGTICLLVIPLLVGVYLWRIYRKRTYVGPG